jgi:putative flippase GtrA
MIQIAKKIVEKQIVRFVLVACLNTLFGYGTFALLIFCGLHYPFAILISTIAGVIFNFKTYGLLVFNSNANRLIIRFVVVYLLVYICNVSGIAIFEYFKISNYLAGMILALPIGFLGYFLNKRFVFNNSHSNMNNE